MAAASGRRDVTEYEVAMHAARFWKRVGKEEPFPRSLAKAVLWALPVTICLRPWLDGGAVQGWVTAAGLGGWRDGYATGRKLRACLIARGGWGVIFLDAADPEDERRYSLAHELAHFLLDYLWPRERAVAALGAGVTPALDGLRVPSSEERLNALFAGVRLGVHDHLMERGPDEGIVSTHVLAVEDAADRLALELLAPAEEARRCGRAAGVNTVNALREQFGLPPGAARAYADFLGRSGRKAQSVRQWFGA